MKQIVRLSYWYHEVNKYMGIDEVVNAWLEAHPRAELIHTKITSDPTFYKGTLYEAILTVETPEKLDPRDSFCPMEQDPEKRKWWDENIAPLYESKPTAKPWWRRILQWAGFPA